MDVVMEYKNEIAEYLKSLGYVYITLDLEGFRSGSMDQKLRYWYDREKAGAYASAFKEVWNLCKFYVLLGEVQQSYKVTKHNRRLL